MLDFAKKDRRELIDSVKPFKVRLRQPWGQFETLECDRAELDNLKSDPYYKGCIISIEEL